MLTTWHRLPGRAAVVAVFLLLRVNPAAAVHAVFDPTGPSFYDLPFPHELRRDPDGTISIAGFPFPENPIVARYAAAIEQTDGFGTNSGVFIKFDGDIDVASLPADPDASRRPGASVFLLNIDPHSRSRGTRIPLWIDFHSTPDEYRDPHLLAMVPVGGHPLEQGTLYAAVVTDALRDVDGLPIETAPAIERLALEAPDGPFEEAALPLYRKLWRQLEQNEGLAREHVVVATIYRTGRPTVHLVAVERFIRRDYDVTASDLAEHPEQARADNYFVVLGHVRSPQFQTGTPPFLQAGTGEFLFDADGKPIVQREETLEFVLVLPKETADGRIRMPLRGWPIAQYMHGTSGDRLSFVHDGTAGRLASEGIASISVDQPLHGLRPGGPGDNFYNPVNPLSFRDNTLQAAADGFVVHRLAGALVVDPSVFVSDPGTGFIAPTSTVHFNCTRRLFFGHSQGATVGPLFLGLARGVRGGVLSAGGGNLLLNILTREEPLLGNMTAKDLVEVLLGAPVDLFHPAIHLVQMGGEVSDPLSYVDRFATHRHGRPLSVLFTHGMQDPDVTTPLTMSMVAAARYPLIAPTYPNRMFPALPGYDYMETFALAGLETLTPPVSTNIGRRERRATGGIVEFESDGHFPVFRNDVAIAQWRGFMHTLAYQRAPVIPVQIE